ncbi:MAG: amidotransferase, partial [Pseudomonadota bacterium]
HDAVTALPDGCTLVATSPGAPVAGFTKGSHILTVQAHPEFTDPFMRAVLKVTEPHLDAATYQTALGTLDQPADGPAFARLAAQFLAGTL